MPEKANAGGEAGNQENKEYENHCTGPDKNQVNFNGIPEGLKLFDQWVVWILAPPLDLKKEKPDKIPINVKTGKGASSTNPKTWAPFDDARTFFEEKKGQKLTVSQKVNGKWAYRTGPVSGVGYVFSKDDPFTGIDVDDCMGNGTPLPWADGIIKGLDSFTEISQSGGGVHTVVEGKKPGAACRKGHIECYDQGRFFAITGRTLNGYKEIKSRQKALDAFYHTHLQKPEPPPQPDRTTYATSHVDTSTVLDRIRRSRNASKIESLMHGNNDGHASASEADQATCYHLSFFCGEIPDAEAYNIVDRIFRESSRYREKWDQVHRPADGATYGQMTIEKALTGERYRAREKPAASQPPEPEPVPDPDQIRKRAEQILRDREPCGPFDLDVLPAIIRDYIRQICERTEADPVIVLSSVLSTLSALAGRRLYIPEGEYFNKLYSNLWFISIALSGDFKTTALNKGGRLAWQKEADIREKIRTLENEAAGEVDLLLPEKETKKKKRHREKAIGEMQAQSCILPNRMSGEGLLELLSEGQGGMIPASEIGDWLSTLGASHNIGLKPLFTDLYDCPRQYSYKTRGGGHLIIRRPFISICGVSTMSWVQENISLKDIGSGFFARFLLFYPPQKRNVPPALPRIQGAFDTEIENKIKAHFDRLQPDHPMTMKPKAARFFENVHTDIYDALGKIGADDQELLAPYSKRWSPYILKLAMLFQAAIDPDDKIGVEAIRAGAAVVQYAMKSTVHLFKNELGESPFQQQCRAVLEFISKKGGSIKRHQLIDSRTLPGGAKEYDDVLSTLEEGNRILISDGPGKIKKLQKIELL